MTVHLQQLKGLQISKQGMWKGYHFSTEGIRKGYIKGVYKKKAKELDLGAEPPRIKIVEYLPVGDTD